MNYPIGTIIYSEALQRCVVIDSEIKPNPLGMGYNCLDLILENQTWILYPEEQGHNIATDKQICEYIERFMGYEEININTTIKIEEDGIFINDDYNCAFLDKKATRKLRTILNERIN